jgi:hypothetical protein
MASRNLSRPYIWALRFGSSLYKIFPCSWDEEEYLLKVDYGREFSTKCLPGILIQTGKIVPILFILIQVVNLAYLLSVSTGRYASTGDILITFIIIGPFSMTFVAYVNFYIKWEEFFALENSFHILDSKFCKNGFLQGGLTSLNYQYYAVFTCFIEHRQKMCYL